MTTVIAAGESSSPGLAVFLLLSVAGWLASVWLFPRARCGVCHATGKILSPSGEHARECPKCRGAKWQTRWARRILSALFSGRR